jgi:hypothetical protein
MGPEIITQTVLVVIIIGISVGVAWISMLMTKKADLVCKELVENHFKEIKLLSDCTLNSGFWPDKGIIALLDDRLVFTSLMFHRNREILLAQVMGVSAARRRGNQKGTRRLELNLGSERLKLNVNSFVFSAWKLALEKKSPMAVATGFPEIK